MRGIGKVLDRASGTARVEYFYSISNRVVETVEESQVNVIKSVAPQTRCYVALEGGRWLMGRLGRLVDAEYEVFSRQGGVRFLHQSLIYVRCLAPIDDPIETLVHKGHETPFFHDRRFRFVRSLVRQRAACRGMTGLVSSRIRLFPHQVEVARRVLEDPVQRYLLADEVGLGKTVEAGVILRQHLIDSRDGRVLVLVPPMLADQWSEELESKFQVSRFGEGRVLVRGTDAVRKASGEGPFHLVVIDEAQHVAALASSALPGDRGLYGEFQSLCGDTRCLLLLSATPVLNNERDFLAMLHLLDPATYDLNDLEGFRARVRNRQEVGHVLLSLQEGSPAYVIGPSVERVRTLFPYDALLARLAGELEATVAGEVVDDAARDRAIRALRVHVSETYRLHRRMLRSRRTDLQGVELLGRATVGTSDRTPRILEHDLDGRSARLHALLDDWRDGAAAACVRQVNADRDGHEPSIVRVFAVLLQCSGTWLELLREAVEIRLGRADTGPSLGDILADDLKDLRHAEQFAGEREILEAMLEVLAEEPEDGDRIDLLAASLANVRKAARGSQLFKCVVFTGHTAVCHHIVRRLRSDFGEPAVAAYHRGLALGEIEAAVRRFRNHPACFVLVCDGSGEEGRNLQFAERVVHFDLPLAPNRMEQRIGRLDRIGRDRQVRSTILIGPECNGSLFAAWYAVLDQGFGVFDRSIAGLQFYVEEAVAGLLGRAFRDGAEGLVASVATVRLGCDEERERVDEQDALDAIDAFDQDAVSCFASVETMEADYAAAEADMHAWVGEALMFRRDQDFYRQERTTLYAPDVNVHGVLRTLVPSDWLQHRLARHIERPGAFDRAVALRVEGTPVLRIGEGFVDAMANYLRWDDRGQSFALWRCAEGWDAAEGAEWVGFRFNYVVSADLREARRFLAEQGHHGDASRPLQRRADALLPPLTETVFLDTDCRPVTDQGLLAILGRPYHSADKGGRDYNLANERVGVIDQLVPPSIWPSLCSRVREASVVEVLGRGEPPLQERCEGFARRAEALIAARVEQLRLRVECGAGADVGDPAAEESVGRAIVCGIRAPELRLDSVGFLVVSGRPPDFPPPQGDL